MKAVYLFILTLFCFTASTKVMSQTKLLQKEEVIYYNDLEEHGIIAVINKDETPLPPGKYKLTLGLHEQMVFTIGDNGNIVDELTYWLNKDQDDEIKVVAEFENGIASSQTIYQPENVVTTMQYKDGVPYKVIYFQNGKIVQETQEDPETKAGFIKEYINNTLKEEEITSKEYPLIDDTLDETVQSNISEPAQYPGGIGAFQKYVARRFNFPPRAKENNINGTAKVEFIVDETGLITNIKPLSNLGHGIEKELIRVIKNDKTQWQPGQDENGKPIATPFTLPLRVRSNQ